MAKQWTPERIKALSPRERARLYENAKNTETPEGDHLIEQMIRLGLPFDEGACASLDDPNVVKMREIVFSDEGRAAAIKATEEGLAAITFIDPMISAAMGDYYGKHNMTTHTVGGFVGELMRELGYHDSGRRAKLPEDCVAKTASIWDRKIG